QPPPRPARTPESARWRRAWPCPRTQPSARRPPSTRRSCSLAPPSSRRKVVAQNSVRRIQHCKRRATRRVGFREVRPYEPCCFRLLTCREGHDHYGRVERPHRLHSQQLELDLRLHRVIQSVHRRFRGAPKLTGRGGHTVGLPRKQGRAGPSQLDLGPAAPVREPLERELLEPQALRRPGRSPPVGTLIGGHQSNRTSIWCRVLAACGASTTSTSRWGRFCSSRSADTTSINPDSSSTLSWRKSERAVTSFTVSPRSRATAAAARRRSCRSTAFMRDAPLKGATGPGPVSAPPG